MFKEKYGISPIYLAVSASIYLLTAVPCYFILFEHVPLLFGTIVVIENIVCFYAFDDQVLKDMIEALSEHRRITFLVLISGGCGLLMFMGLMVYNFTLFLMLCIVEMFAFTLIRGIQALKK